MCKIDILLSTANNRVKFLDDCFCGLRNDSNLLIVHQRYGECDSQFVYPDLGNVVIDHRKGLSRSRNIAIDHAVSDICLICDDDVRLIDGFDDVILRSYEENSEADIICFQAVDEFGEYFRKYHPRSRWINYKTVMNVSSIEISFRLRSIVSNNISFDERFGLGTQFPTGEESIFLMDSLKKGLKILYLPLPIVQHPLDCSGNDWDNKNMIIAKGAMFYRMYGRFAVFLCFLFSLKKYGQYKGSVTFLMFFKLLLQGVSRFSRSC